MVFPFRHAVLSCTALIALAGCSAQALQMASVLASNRATVEEPVFDVPYVGTPYPVVAAMLDLAALRPDDYLIDLGSGDGRIGIAAAQRGARALGVDIDPERVAQANAYARGDGVETRAFFRRQDLFDTPIREASVVTLYLLPEINLRLRPRLITELRPGTRIVSHAFAMGDWRADETRRVEGANIYMWIVPATVGGTWALTDADGDQMVLQIDQRFQDVTGTLGGVAIANARLRGDRFSFAVPGPGGARTFHGIVDGADLRPDPAGPGGTTGWSARRAA